MKARITGTKNIAKITKSMKMVSAAKLRGDQQRLVAATPFAVSMNITVHNNNLKEATNIFSKIIIMNIFIINSIGLRKLLDQYSNWKIYLPQIYLPKI